MILPGLRSEEMEKEKNTRKNKSQSNVNMGRTERSCLSPWRQPENIFCCQNQLDRTHAPVKAIHLPIQVSHPTIHSLFIHLCIYLVSLVFFLSNLYLHYSPKKPNKKKCFLKHLICSFYSSKQCFVSDSKQDRRAHTHISIRFSAALLISL